MLPIVYAGWRVIAAATVVAAAACSGSGAAHTAPTPSHSASSPPAPGPSRLPTRGLTATDWPTYHRDQARSGYAPATSPPGRLSRAWTATLDGAVYGQPLVVGSTVVAATENDSVYALELVTGKIRWRIHLGTAVSLSSLPCGNIDPLGITGTPVYDPATRQVFVVAEASGPRHVLAAIRLADGRVAWTRDVERPGGDPRVHQQRAALALGNGLVYVAFGGLEGDCGPYIGTVVAVLTNGQGAPHVWTVPTPREGGIWAPPGPVIDPSGAVYVAVGNGESTKAYDGSDSVTKLSPTLARIDFFAPSRWAQENAQDADLGSASPALVGGYVFQAGKGGVGYLLSPAHLGGIGGELASIDLHCRSFGGDAVVGHVVYLPCEDGVRAVEVASGPSLRQLWRSAHAVNGPPVVGGGVVWALDSHAGVLYVLDQASGRTRTTLRVGSLPHFASPTLSGGRALIGTTSGVVCLTGA